jgi:hypothetical protein
MRSSNWKVDFFLRWQGTMGSSHSFFFGKLHQTIIANYNIQIAILMTYTHKKLLKQKNTMQQ